MINDTPITLSSSQSPTSSVIWLHGLGADGSDFVPVVEMLNLPNVRFILPHAPYRKVTVNNGYEMRAWYNLFGLTIGSREDETGIREAQDYLESLIAHEVSRGIPHNKIVLAGFSQGGAIALHTALRHNQALAGILALSTYLPLKSFLPEEKSSANQHTPIFMAHGAYDEVISLETCRVSLALLLAQQYQVDWHEYPMAHSVCMEEIDDIRSFLSNTLDV
jgi:phospholipase/carboxylesterase